jgi:hypothetical protein
MTETARVFVGTAANHEDAESQAVLEYSLRRHASIPVEITWMKQSRDPTSLWYTDPQGGWRTERWATPFSGFRWAIPYACDYEGRAVYTDSDVIFTGDIAELWRTPMAPGKAVVAKGKGSWRFCVSLWDCAAAAEHLDPIRVLMEDPHSHKAQGARFRAAGWVQPFGPGQNWNCLDGEDKPLDAPSTKAIHYTAMANQPHLRHAIPRLAAAGREHWFNGRVEPHWRPDLIELFDRLLAEADAAGFPVSRYTADPIFGPYRKMDLAHYRAGPRK